MRLGSGSVAGTSTTGIRRPKDSPRRNASWGYQLLHAPKGGSASQMTLWFPGTTTMRSRSPWQEVDMLVEERREGAGHARGS
jgi:hypothetical protein